MQVECHCCGNAYGCFKLCPECGLTFAWSCWFPHRRQEHSVQIDPETSFRWEYRTPEDLKLRRR